MKRHKHNLSHYRLMDANLGLLYPISCMEVLPGDTFRQSSTALVRMATLVTPVMHPVKVSIHHWFVPNRIIWSDWEAFITNRLDTTLPTITNTTTVGTLPDYLGVAPHAGDINALPVYAYNKIYNEFYRDQDLSAERLEDDDTIAMASWQKDYFTTARLYPSQNDEEFTVSFSTGSAPIKGLGLYGTASPNVTGQTGFKETGDPGTRTVTGWQTTNNTIVVEQDPDDVSHPFVRADLSEATGGINIEDIRTAFALQRFSEARNRYGSRYVDYLRYLGVRPSDNRLDRPEYLGGGKQTVSFSEVLATAEGENTSVGDQFGHGIAAVRTRPYRRFFEEHGHVISLLSVRPKTIYMDEVPKNYLRSISRDYWQKEYEVMGDQPITNREVYGPSGTPTDVFGYTERFREYREAVSGVAGLFRTTLADWHFARDFTSQPVLNQSFIDCDPDLRPFAAQSEAQMYVMAANQVAARRLVAKRAR